jgi:hypothetical protein
MIAVALLGWGGIALADVKLLSVIGDHMVVQQGMPVPVWGDNPECTLVNGADLPAVPFRTDRL